MSRQLIYTGIGSRQTPESHLHAMQNIGAALAQRGWLLRSGHAPGADQAFEIGCLSRDGKKEIFLPWDGFENAPHNDPDYITPNFSANVMQLASEIHPAWNKCNPWVKKLHARNINQVIGPNDHTPVLSDLVICATKNASGTGGTGQAIRLANRLGIPVFDLGDDAQWNRLDDFINELEKLNSR